MVSEWRKNLDKFLQEHMLAVSLVFAIISGFMTYVGMMGEFYSTSSLSPDMILDVIGDYDIFVFIFGLIIFGFSAYYLWLTKHYMDRFEEIISTSSKKEFQKNWTEIEQIARYQLPKEYRKRVAEARKKFGLK
ncbi:MAG: DUF3198 domain-containing protein [Candidatus Thermoplasmatota archaeon]|jgi:hypothetical protein|nr:DUF3198 domain-containing protein [Candidatus Thermoplasmatota archaeon]MEC7415920.1 DUF3198 domain-containing protein [Candidatus Thermoplasmatota archaeon]MEC7697802.1 DUF3198 domain-containing protein [Candidatus Thermoplasmatota archaeon]MEC8671986.1 DUF3198 domain-containing protein [Candidatus Thermoplasmatota archaeon]MEC9138237.1 DUF3198 domain-containing protein [Candidatus Thermoplasmatota archaeon]|tara:strand:+ start:7830 stop:8228 length:399 start_codon:yes stop_codon:yes gene_type:complete